MTTFKQKTSGPWPVCVPEAAPQLPCPSLSVCMEEMIAEARLQGRSASAYNFCAALHRLTRFLGGDIAFHQLTPDVLFRFERAMKADGLKRNSTSFYMRQLRILWRWAERRGYAMPAVPFGAVYTGVDRTRKRAVGLSTIRRLLLLDLGASRPLAWARDLFVLSFYLRGIPFVDLAFLRKSDVCQGIVRYERRKTGTPMEVRLEPCMTAVLQHYADAVRHSPYLLPILSETNEEAAYRQYRNRLSYYNKCLKELSARLDLCGERLTSYTPRHSWATSAYRLGVSLSVISAAMGHSSETTTRIYLAALDASAIDRANHTVLTALQEDL